MIGNPVSRRRKRYRLALLGLALLYAHALGYFGPAFEPSEQDDRAVVLATMRHVSEWSVSAQIRGNEHEPLFLVQDSMLSYQDAPILTFASWPRLFQLGASVDERNRVQTLFDWESTGDVYIGNLEEHWSPIGTEDFPYRCFAFSTRPGYSRDGRFAQVLVSLGPSAHGNRLTFLLRKSAMDWEVVWRDSIFYV